MNGWNTSERRGCDVNLQKQTRWENKKYIKWVCTQDCVVCGEPGYSDNQIVPHHIKGIGHLSGGALKAGDNWAMPMHVKCHNYFHHEVLKDGYGWVNGNVIDTTHQYKWVARTLAKAVEEGVLKV